MWNALDTEQKIEKIKNDLFNDNNECRIAYMNLCNLQKDYLKPGKIFESISYAHVLHNIDTFVPKKHLNIALHVLQESIIQTVEDAIDHLRVGEIRMFLQTMINNRQSTSTLKFPDNIFKIPLIRQCYAIELLTMHQRSQYEQYTDSTWVNMYGGYEDVLGTPFRKKEDILNFVDNTFEGTMYLASAKNMFEQMNLAHNSLFIYEALKRELYKAPNINETMLEIDL